MGFVKKVNLWTVVGKCWTMHTGFRIVCIFLHACWGGQRGDEREKRASGEGRNGEEEEERHAD